jgi:predicted ATP-grasp superfamily ATP-dependent carboligase
VSRRALVLDGGSGPALAVTRSLGRAGWEVLAQAGTRSARSRFASAACSVPAATDDPQGFAEALDRILRRTRVDLVVPCTDASVTLLREHEHVLRGAKILGGDRASTRLCLDKAQALEAADRAGFGVPAWVVPSTLAEATAAAGEIGLPVVVKPRRSYQARDGALVQRRSVFVEAPEQLDEAVRRSADGDALPVVQAFVRGRSLAVTAVVRDGAVLAHAARETLTFLPIGGGTSVWKRTIPPDTPGVEEAVRLLQRIGYEGLAEVEYQLGEDGAPRLMEIGVRAHGWIGLAIAAGVDVPAIAAAALFGEQVPPERPYRVGLEMRWPAGELRRLAAAASPRTELPPGTTRAGIVRSAWPPWKPGMRYDGLDLGDPRPWLPLVWRLHGRSRTGEPGTDPRVARSVRT